MIWRNPLLLFTRVSIFADYATAVAMKWATFRDVKHQLRTCPGINFGIIYPVVLRITLRDSSTHKFESLVLAADFIEMNLNGMVWGKWAMSWPW